MSSNVLLVNLAVLFAVLEADLGRRRIGWFRIARPLLMSATIVPMFIEHPATSGNGALLELALAAVGIMAGLFASTVLMRVDFDAARQRAVSSTAIAYALFWVTLIGARLAFTYGADHWYTASLGHWMLANGISPDALTDGLIFMAIAMAVTRTLRLAAGRIQLDHGTDRELAVRA